MNEYIESRFVPEFNLRVSEYGEISRIIKGKRKIYAHNNCKAGYHRIGASFKSARKSFSVHRLVAFAFIPNPGNLPEVNHIDFDKSNNHYSNLEWCTHKQNQNHLIDSGRWSQRIRFFQCEERNKQIFIDLDGGMTREEVATKHGLKKAALYQVIKTHGKKAA